MLLGAQNSSCFCMRITALLISCVLTTVLSTACYTVHSRHGMEKSLYKCFAIVIPWGCNVIFFYIFLWEKQIMLLKLASWLSNSRVGKKKTFMSVCYVWFEVKDINQLAKWTTEKWNKPAAKWPPIRQSWQLNLRKIHYYLKCNQLGKLKRSYCLFASGFTCCQTAINM